MYLRNIKEKILELQQISETLEPTEIQRHNYIEKVNNYANTFINNLPKTNAYSNKKETPNSFAITNQQKTIEEIVSIYDKEVASKGINPASGGHLGYIPGGGIYTSAIADYLVDITNEYAGIYYASPGAVAIENELINWMKSIFRFPETAIGNLTSGGSIANLIALTAARDKYKVKGELIEKSVVYMSPQVHHCVAKALQIIGLADVIVREIVLDDAFKMDSKDLEVKIKMDKANGLNPYLVVASAGTTDTGVIDPMEAIGELTKQHDLWFHVDGAYGGFFILAKSVKHMFKGIELADSLVIDPHKSLFLPYGLGAVLIKDKEAVFQSNKVTANYMQDAIIEDIPYDPANVSPELTKHFRSLRLWLPLQLHGIKPFSACLEEKILLTQYFREQLIAYGYKVGPKPDLSVSYFWYPSQQVDENKFNEHLLQEIHKDGEVFLSSTIIDGKFVIRIAVVSFRTKLTTIDKAIRVIERARKKIKLNAID